MKLTIRQLRDYKLFSSWAHVSCGSSIRKIFETTDSLDALLGSCTKIIVSDIKFNKAQFIAHFLREDMKFNIYSYGILEVWVCRKSLRYFGLKNLNSNLYIECIN